MIGEASVPCVEGALVVVLAGLVINEKDAGLSKMESLVVVP